MPSVGAGVQAFRIATAFGASLALTACLSMWFGGPIRHPPASGFASLGSSNEEWVADFGVQVRRSENDGTRVMATLRKRGATCGERRVSGTDGREPFYVCVYAFCRTAYYQTYTWEFPKRLFSFGEGRLQYANVNLSPHPACALGAEPQRLSDLQRQQACFRTEDVSCSGHTDPRGEDI